MAEQHISHSGLVARSPEGHAAKGMQIKGQEDIWVEIQAHTFRNWVNEQLRPTGLTVRDLSSDLSDEVKLIALVEVLQKRRIRKIERPMNQHHYLENTQNALNAITADGIKLVNIGNEDIVNGNQKLILGLIWSLIAHYQIGRSRFPPKKLMLAWLKAVLPDCQINNFTQDWNSGISLSALLDYCKPGLFPHWNDLDPHRGLDNCKNAMQIAKDEFKVPMVLEPEYLSSPYLDELSGMTYLSYFMREGGPGYKATLRWVQNQISEHKIKNFTTDWNNGLALCSLVRSLGGPVPGYNQLLPDPPMWESNLSVGMKGGERLGVEPLLKPKDMADPHVDHLGPMSYVARYQWIPKRKRPSDRLHVTADKDVVRINNPVHFRIEFNDMNIDVENVKIVVNGPHGRVDPRVNFTGTGGSGSFVPVDMGMHELVVYCEDEVVSGCPIHIRAMPDVSKVMLGGLDPCAIGSIVEVLINSNGAGGGKIDVTAVSPTGRSKVCPVSEDDGVYTATFQPDEAGQWNIAVTYDGEHIQSSPFTCFVYDANAIRIRDTDGVACGRKSVFTCDGTKAGVGDIAMDIVYNNRSISHQMLETDTKGMYYVHFFPSQPGKYKIYVYFNGMDVKGSPWILKIPEHGAAKLYSSHESKKSRHSESHEKSSHKKKEEKHIRHTSTTLDKSRYSEETKKDSLPRRIRPDIKLSTEFINGVTVTRQDYDNATHTDGQFKVSLNEKRDINLSNTQLPTSSPLESPKVVRQIESPRGHYNSSLDSSRHYSTSIDTSHQYSERSRHYTPPRDSSRHYTPPLDSSRHYTPPPDSPRRYSPPLDSPRRYSPPLESSRQYTPPLESTRQYTPPVDSPRQYTPPRRYSPLESPRQYTPPRQYSPLESPKQYSPLDSPKQIRSLDTDNIYHSYERTEKRTSHSVVTHTGTDVVDAGLHRSVGMVTAAPQTADISVSGDALSYVSVNTPTSLIISPTGTKVSADDVSVKITDPYNLNLPYRVTEDSSGGVRIQFTPRDSGEHLIHVKVKDSRVSGSPFQCFAYSASELKVGNIPSGTVGKPVQFEIDGSKAGAGDLNILVNGGHVTSYVKDLGEQRFLASFVPHRSMTHTIDMTFNGEKVPGK